MKKLLSVLVVVLVVASLASAAPKDPAKPKKIVAFLDTIMEVQDGHKQLIQEYKKLTGIDLEIIKPAHNQYYEKLRLVFAAGDIPDVVEISERDYVNFASEGAFRDLEPLIAKSEISKKIDQNQFEAVRVKGKIYGYPTQIGAGPVTYLRKDWLENLGLKPPKTWDEYYKVLKAFTFNDPDKNGKHDTYGFTSSGTTDGTGVIFANNFYRDFFHNANPDFVMVNGKWIDGFAQPEMKSALERLGKAYQEKLIDPEIFTNKTSTCREKFQSGKAGIFPYWWGTWNARLENELQKNLGPNAKMLAIPAIKESHYTARVPQVLAITSKCKNTEGVFKYFVEFMHDSGPGQMLFIHGVENVHWAKKDGVYVKLPSLTDPSKLFVKVFLPPETVLTPWNDPIPMDERYTSSRDIFLKNYRQMSLEPMPESRIKVEQEILTLKSLAMGKVLMGQISADQAVENYKKEARKLGIDKILADMNKMKK